MQEFRIYYESLEQAEYFFKPAVLKAIGKRPNEIRMIRLAKVQASSVIADRLYAALCFKDPDAIVTVVQNGEEFPLVWIEVSTAVETEDHVLQRFDSMVAAARARIPFVKVQARRVSGKDHGGKKSFDRLMGYKLLWNKWQVPALELDWPTTEDSRRAVRLPGKMACPPSSLGLDDVIAAALLGVEAGDTAIDGVCSSRVKFISDSLAAHRAGVTALPAKDTKRLFKDASGKFTLKFNRWTRAMDPERGMVWYYGARTGARLNGRLEDKHASTADEALAAFERATGFRYGGPRGLRNGTTLNVDTWLGGQLSRAGLAIFWNCDNFTIARKDGVDLLRLVWTKKEPVGLAQPGSTGPVTLVTRWTDVREDEVTFVVANHILPANGFAVDSVSYPGAQGDFALVLGSGRKALRRYPDTIALGTADQTVAIVESKGDRTRSKLIKDAEKSLSWQEDALKRRKLLEALARSDAAKVLAVVAFPGSKDVDIAQCEELDATVAVDSEQWHVFARTDALKRAISIQRGDTALPERFAF